MTATTRRDLLLLFDRESHRSLYVRHRPRRHHGNRGRPSNLVLKICLPRRTPASVRAVWTSPVIDASSAVQSAARGAALTTPVPLPISISHSVVLCDHRVPIGERLAAPAAPIPGSGASGTWLLATAHCAQGGAIVSPFANVACRPDVVVTHALASTAVPSIFTSAPAGITTTSPGPT